MPSLDSLYTARFGSTDSLAAAIRTARRATFKRLALELPRDGKTVAPMWKLAEVRTRKPLIGPSGSRVTVLDFWATWCQPCRTSLPGINRLSVELKGRGVAFIGVAIEGVERVKAAKRVLQFIGENGIRMPIALGDDSLVEDFGVHGYPTTFVIQNGRVQYRNEGAQPPEFIRAQIVSLLNPTPSP
jgi:thiol-disulfide isomerase/thioredoxin